MIRETLMKVWIHPPTGKIIISWPFYTDESIIKGSMSGLVCFRYAGEAIENENGVTYVFPPDYLDNFEFIGEF